MLLLHTTGSVKIGEIVRYTVTYTPSLDSAPLPTHLHLRIKNTAALPLRAAYLHGPYTVYVSVRRQEFHPYSPWTSEIEGDKIEVPQYDPNLKAGASFYTQLTVPEKLIQDASDAAGKDNTSKESKRATKSTSKSVTWIVEIISQTIFSNKASVGFELLIGRDEKSIGYGFPFGTGNYSNLPGPKISSVDDSETAESTGKATGAGGAGGEVKYSGVLSDAIKLKVQDTADLWNLPPFPSWSEEKSESSFPESHNDPEGSQEDLPDPDELDDREHKRKQEEAARRKSKVTKKVHLVIITHGLHSNTGADMLFLKEAIDEEVRKSEEAYQKKVVAEKSRLRKDNIDGSIESKERFQENDGDREMVIVRGFHDNACRTERGIKYLGRRLAKYILLLANPELPNPNPLQNPLHPTPNKLRKHHHHPHLTPAARAHSYTSTKSQGNSTPEELPKPAYKVTSISLIGHSLGGLVQTYAIAYIHAHHQKFFEETKPVNFVALASPFLGLSNENPLYVKFALDFGLVGRTGQDLGLTWRAPNMAASALHALANRSPFTNNSKDTSNGGKADTSKPLLRILPTGPAHEVLKLFRNRTVYANVVNDGIVPLRTSCLLYLDWKGLDKVEKARRENAAAQVAGLVGWGLSQLTTTSSPRTNTLLNTQRVGQATTTTTTTTTTSAMTTATNQAENSKADAAENTKKAEKNKSIEASDGHIEDANQMELEDGLTPTEPSSLVSSPQPINESTNPFSSLLTLFRPQAGKKPAPDKTPKIYRRSQITPSHSPCVNSPILSPTSPVLSRSSTPPLFPHQPSLSSPTQDTPTIITSYDDYENPIFAPPKTSFLEAAGDLLNPPLPDVEFIMNPQSRPKTIWHDRVYHSEDIPPPPLKKRTRSMLGLRFSNSTYGDFSVEHIPENGTMEGGANSAGEVPSRKDTSSTNASNTSQFTSSSNGHTEKAQLKVEEKIARAYHKELSWRKVLVRLEPDAHNNIIVRRMFANAYGWPVVKHLVDTHFADTPEANTADIEEGREERATVYNDQQLHHGRRVRNGKLMAISTTTTSTTTTTISRNGEQSGDRITRSGRSMTNSTEDSALWDDAVFEVTDDEDTDGENAVGQSTPKSNNENRTSWNGGLGIRWPLIGASGPSTDGAGEGGTSADEIEAFLHSGQSHTHTATPIASVSKIDAYGGLGPNSARPSLDGARGFVFDDAVKVGLGSSAMRELVKVKSRSISEQGKGNSTLALAVDNEEREGEGVVERVNRLSLHRG